MKRPQVRIQLSERQQLILALLIVVIIAISLLYCVGFGSLAVRQAWRNTPSPSAGTLLPAGENVDVTPTLLPVQSPLSTPPAP